MKNLWDYEEELKGLGHRLSKELPRNHLEYALAHVRQAIRSELYDENETPETIHKTIQDYLAFEKILIARNGKAASNGTD